ncbi:MAG: L-aspartate oxidase [Ruminococcaceae bacterium]|nr:L-aspartate oxidase [Oscillospiraceae bacterium]
MEKRRYIFNNSLYNKPVLKDDKAFDVAVIGGGMAGLFAALELDEKYKVAVFVKGRIEDGSSFLAQGGMCCVLGADDSFEEHVADTLCAGAGHCNEDAVRVMVKGGPESVRKLIDYGVHFDIGDDGKLKLTREGGHGKRRILHCGGDATGREITKALGNAVMARKNIKVFWNHTCVDILTDKEGVCGAVINDGACDFVVRCANLVVATGGAGQLYRYSTTPEGNTGEGIAACKRAGCELADMEFVQFHPTAFAIHREGERVFLISEAVRGEGAILKNKNGESFMSFPGQHPQKDLAPRDIVTRAILAEMRRVGDDRVYLDTSSMTKDFFEKSFPTITAKCHENGIFPPDDLIPVHPTQHYLMGGVVTDLDAKTSVDGLFVCGEAACTGVHGANRLASNSTLECVVFAKRAAEYINRNPRSIPDKAEFGKNTHFTKCVEKPEILSDMQKIKAVMTEKVGAERTVGKLLEAKGELLRLYEKYCDVNFTNCAGYALFSGINTAMDIVDAALSRRESIGSHYITE